jgi:RNA polymerase sigma factor (sigma-70 family)
MAQPNLLHHRSLNKVDAAFAMRDAARDGRAVSLWQQMCESAAAGDDSGYFRARTALYNMFEDLSFYVIARFFGYPRADRDDLRQECRIAVVEAIDHWDPQRGEFPVLLTYHVRRRIRRYLRNSEMIRRTHSAFDRHGQETSQGREGVETAPLRFVSLDAPMANHLSCETSAFGHHSDKSMGEIVSDSDAAYEHIQDQTAVAQALEYLPQLERETVCLYFGLEGRESHSYRDIAPILGCSYMTAKNRVDRALPILAAALEGVL